MNINNCRQVGLTQMLPHENFVFAGLFIYFGPACSAYTQYFATVAAVAVAVAASDITPERVEVERKIAPKDAPLIDKSFLCSFFI